MQTEVCSASSPRFPPPAPRDGLRSPGQHCPLDTARRGRHRGCPSRLSPLLLVQEAPHRTATRCVRRTRPGADAASGPRTPGGGSALGREPQSCPLPGFLGNVTIPPELACPHVQIGMSASLSTRGLRRGSDTWLGGKNELVPRSLPSCPRASPVVKPAGAHSVHTLGPRPPETPLSRAQPRAHDGGGTEHEVPGVPVPTLPTRLHVTAGGGRRVTVTAEVPRFRVS